LERTGHTHIKTKIKTDKVNEQKTIAMAIDLRDAIVRNLIEHKGFEPQPKIRVALVMLRDAISGVTGVIDKRSIKSRITLLESNRLISRDPDPKYALYEIVTGYKVEEEEDDHTAKPPSGVVG
jgi:hypothetical protein